MSEPRQVIPTFLYIGAGKAGSSWMFEALREHPEVYVPVAKDLQFFDTNYSKGLHWYFGFFTDGENHKAVGELSHNYFRSQETAVRIFEALPQVKLLCTLREPVDRTVSAFIHARAVGLDTSIDFEDFAFRPEIIAASDYLRNLRPFYDRFPRQNIQVLFFDDLRKDPTAFLRQVYRYLEVDVDFIPTRLSEKVLTAREARSWRLARIAYRAAGLLRSFGHANLVGRIKRLPIFEFSLYRRLPNKPEVPPEVRERLGALFSTDYEALARLIGRDLPGSWYEVAAFKDQEA